MVKSNSNCNVGDVACVILAAGNSSRFGDEKLLQRLDTGVGILEQTIKTCQVAFDQVFVVCKNHPPLYEVIERCNAELVLNSYANQGLSQSIIAGLEATSSAEAWMFVLADMPFVQAHTIKSMLEEMHVQKIVQPSYQGRRGNPVLIGRAFCDELSQLSGDTGAKRLLQDNAENLIIIETQDSGIHQDIDTLDDLKRLQNR